MGRKQKTRRGTRGQVRGELRQREALPWEPRSLPELLDRAVPKLAATAPAANRKGAQAIQNVITGAQLFWLGENVMPVVASFADDLTRQDILDTIAISTTALVTEAPLPPLPKLPVELPGSELLEGIAPSGVVLTMNAAGKPYIIPLAGALELLDVDPSLRASDEEITMTLGSKPLLPGDTDLVALGVYPLDGLSSGDPRYQLARWFSAARLLCDIPAATTTNTIRVLRGNNVRTRGQAQIPATDLRTVRVINLAPATTPRPTAATAGKGHRSYSYRWPVKGHQRLQACGPGLTERRPIWIPPHMKGPDGAPLLRKVTAWTDPTVVSTEPRKTLVGDKR